MNLDDLIGEELTPATHKTYGVASKEVRQKGADLSELAGEELTPQSSSWDRPKPPAEGGDFGRGFGVAWTQLKQTGYGAAGLAGAAAGWDSVRDWGLEGYQRLGKEVAAGAARTDDITNVESVEDAVDWAQYGAGYVVGQGLQALGSGGFGSLIGKALAKKGVEKLLAKQIEKDVAKRVAAGAAEEAAKAAALNSAARYFGAAVGVAALNYQQEAGSIYGDAVEEAHRKGLKTEDVSLGRVAGSAAVAASVDTFTDMLGIGRLLKGTGTGNVFGRMVRGALAQGAIEGVTEATQTGIERWGAGKEIFGEGSLGEYINAAALGALGGGMVGAAGGVRGKKADKGLSGLPETDITAVPGQGAAEPYDQQVERAYGVKLGLPTEQEFSARQQEGALRDLDAGLNPAPATDFDPASYWEGFAPVAPAAQGVAAPDTAGNSLDRAAKAAPASVAVSQMLAETQEALTNLISRPGVFGTIEQAQKALDDIAKARHANGEQAFMRRPDRNLGEPIPPAPDAPLPPGAPANPAAQEAAAARMTRGLGAPQQGDLGLVEPQQPPATVANATVPAAVATPAGQPGVAQVAQPAQPAPSVAPATDAPVNQAPTSAVVGTDVPTTAAPPSVAPAPEAAPLGSDDLSVPGTDYNGEPAQISFLTDGTKLTDARIRYADGTEIGIALKKGDTFESVVARAENDGDFTREEGFVIGQPKAEKAKAAADAPQRTYSIGGRGTPRGESVDPKVRAEQEASLAKLKKDIAKRRKSGRAKREIDETADMKDREVWVNQKLARETGMKKSITLVETPARWKAMVSVIETLWGQRIQFWSPVNSEINRLYEGMSIPGDPDTVYLSVNSQNPALFLMGHEFGHNISKINPQLWSRFLEELKPILDKKEVQQYVHALKARYDRQAKLGGRKLSLAEVGAISEEEIAADALGQAFMDPKFWKALSGAVRPEAKPLVARMLSELQAFLDEVLDLLKANVLTRSGKLFKDTRQLNRAVTELLLDYGGLRDVLPYKELVSEAEKFYAEKMEPDSNEADWAELGKDLQEQFVELYDLFRMGDISFNELEADYLRIQKAWRAESVNDELKQRLSAQYAKQMATEAGKFWDTNLREDGEPRFKELTDEWKAYFVEQYRKATDESVSGDATKVSLADAFDKAVEGTEATRAAGKEAAQQTKKAATRTKKAAQVAAAKAERALEVERKNRERIKQEAEEAAAKALAKREEQIAKAQEKALAKAMPKAAEALQTLTPAEKKRVSAFYKVKGWTEDVAKAFTREVAKLLTAGDNESLIDAVPDKLRPIIWRILRNVQLSMKSGSGPLDNPAFVRWFGDSKMVVRLTEIERETIKAVEANGVFKLEGWERRDYERLKAKQALEGQPEVWYHGTSRDIDTFQPKQANAIFVTQSLRFAEDFANYSAEWSREHKIKNFGASIYPLYVKAEKPFDFEDQTSVEEVLAEVIDYLLLSPEIEQEAKAFGESQDKVIKAKIDAMRREINRGEWSTIESKEVQRAIKALGFDSFFVKEAGIKNLAVYKSSQVKSVYGNRGTYNDVGNISHSLKDEKPMTRAEKRAAKEAELAARREGAREMLAGLSEEEAQHLIKKDGTLTEQAARFMEIQRALPSAEEMASVAWAGRAKRGWYMDSVKAIQQVFGQDAPRFAALLAAMSPQTSVEANLQNALAVWANWTKAGRPTGKDDIFKIMGRSVQQSDLKNKPKYALDKIAKQFGIPLYFSREQMVEALEGVARRSQKNRDLIKQMSVLDAWVNNAVRALSADDPVQTVLSGPKVDSFYRNLTGDLNEVTNDAWMAAYAAIDQKLFGGKLSGRGPGKSSAYLAMSSRVRQAAARLSELTGDVWTPAEVQETIWAWAKTLYELQEVAGETRDAVQLLNDGALTDELIAATPDFRSLFNDNAKPYQRLLADAGLADRLGPRTGIPVVDHGRGRRAKRGAQGEARAPAGVGTQQHLVAAAQRLADRRGTAVEEDEVALSLKEEVDGVRGVNVEVAPNPDNVDLAGAFDKLPEARKIAATYDVAGRIIPQILDSMDVDAAVEYTVGGFEGASNPSLIVKFGTKVPFDTMVEVGKVIGYVFQQKAIIAYDEQDGGGTQTGFVKVSANRSLSYDEQKQLFAQLYEIMPDAAGFTGRDGTMVFGNFTDLSDAEFSGRLEAALTQLPSDLDFQTQVKRFRSEWVEPVTLEGTRYGEGNQSPDQTGRDVLRRQGGIDSLRREADGILSSHVASAEAGLQAGGEVALSLKDAGPVVEVYGLQGDKVRGLASYSPTDKVWTIWRSADDIRTDANITPIRVAKTEDALNALRGPGIHLARRRASPFNEGERTPGDFGIEVEKDGAEPTVFTRAMDALVAAANRVFASNLDGAELRREFVRRVQDAYVDVRVVQQTIRRKGGRITGANDLYQAITLYPGRTGAQMQAFERRFAEPMEQQIEAALRKGASVESIEEWLIARHAEERNAIIRQRTGGQNDAGSGMTDANAQAILAQTQPWQQELNEIGRIADEIGKFKLGLMLSSGLIDQQTHDALSNYKHYVPLKGLDEDDTGELTAGFGTGTGTGFSGKGSLLQYATGRNSRARHVISHLLLDAESKIVRAGKNEVAKSLLKLAEDFPDPTFWKVNEVKSRPVFDPDSGAIKMQADPDFLNPNIIVAYVDGKGSKVEVTDDSFARALTNASAAGSNSVLEFMRRLNGWWSQMVTTYNPVWTIVNGLRDAQTAYFNIKADPNLPPDMGAKVLKNIAAMNPRAGIWELMRDPDADNEWSRLYRELEREGGITHFFGVTTLEDRARKMQEMENRVSRRGLPAKAQDAWRKARGPEFAKLLQDMGATIEAVPRVAAYKALVESGWSKADAADYAKNLTVNFNRKGSQKFLSAAYMFFNPAVQGTARLYTALKTDEGKAIAGGLMMLGFLAGLVGNGAGDDDQNGIPDYQQFSDFERATNIILWPNGPKVPLPYGWNAFYAVGNYLSDLFYGRGPMHVAWKSLKAMSDAFDPVGSADAKNFANWMVKAASPTVTDPLVMWALNDNAFGSSIVPEGASRTFRPDSESGRSSVGWVWREGARALNRATGGSAASAGAIDVNPNTLDHFFSAYLPGWPQEAIKTASTTAKMARGEDVEAREVPAVRKVWAQPQKTSYDDLAQAKEKLAELAAMQKGDAEDRRTLTRDYPGWLGVKVAFDSKGKQISDLHKKKARITDGKLKVSDPAAEKKQIDDRIAKLQNEMLRLFNEQKGKWRD